MTSRTFIGIDPGAAGAVAWSDRTGVHVYPMPDTRGDCITLIKGIVDSWMNLGNSNEPMVAYIEKITGFIPDGGASQMFEFGKNVERMGCICETLGIRLIEITPQAWQKCLGLGTSDRMRPKKDSTDEERKAIKVHNAAAKRDWKNKLKENAQRRFPDQKVTLKTCDALLILDVGIKMEGQQLL